MSYVLDDGALWIFFLDTPEGEGKIVGVSGVDVQTTSYILVREMHMTYHHYGGEALRAIRVDDLEEEVEPGKNLPHDERSRLILDLTE